MQKSDTMQRFEQTQNVLVQAVLRGNKLDLSLEHSQQSHLEQGIVKELSLPTGKLANFVQKLSQQDACYTGITRDAGADSFIPTVCFAD